MRWKGEEIEGGEEEGEGGGGEDPARSRYDPAERGRASVASRLESGPGLRPCHPRRGVRVGSRTDLESRIMPRPCWNFWGPYWPISRVSDHPRAQARAPARASLVARHPTTPCQSQSGSRPWGSSNMCIGERAHGFLLPPSFTRCPRESSSSPLPLLSPFLRPSSSSLPFRPRNVGENPRRLARIFLGLYYNIIVEGARRWYRERAGSSAPRKGALFFSRLFTHPPYPFPLSLSIPPSSSSSSSPSSSPSRRPNDLRIAHSFFVRWTFLPWKDETTSISDRKSQIRFQIPIVALFRGLRSCFFRKYNCMYIKL